MLNFTAQERLTRWNSFYIPNEWQQYEARKNQKKKHKSRINFFYLSKGVGETRPF